MSNGSSKIVKSTFKPEVIKTASEKTSLFTLHQNDRKRISKTSYSEIKISTTKKFSSAKLDMTGSIPNNNVLNLHPPHNTKSKDILDSIVKKKKPNTVKNLMLNFKFLNGFNNNLSKFKINLRNEKKEKISDLMKRAFIDDNANTSKDSKGSKLLVSHEEESDKITQDDFKFSKIKKKIKSILTGKEEIIHKVLEENKKNLKQKIFYFEEVRQFPHIKNNLTNSNKLIQRNDSYIPKNLKKKINFDVFNSIESQIRYPNTIDHNTNFHLSFVKRNFELEKEKIKLSQIVSKTAQNHGNIKEKVSNYYKSNCQLVEDILDEDRFIIYNSYFVDRIERFKNIKFADDKIKKALANYEVRWKEERIKKIYGDDS